MTDKELLELAAKAAGIKLRWWDNGRNGFRVCNDTGSVCKRLHWNPIEDDRDALRLAVKLGINVAPGTATNRFSVAHGCSQVLEERKPDKYAATRRAITRAAAEIGKAMP